MYAKIPAITKRSIWAFSLVLAVTFGGTASNGAGFESVACATRLASYKGVPARSNQSYPYDSCGGQSVYGLKYQCVEYIRRFYFLVKGIETRQGMTGGRWNGNADTYFRTAEEKGLDTFENGGPVPPLPDDIISFRGGPHGHVAVITAVTDQHIEFIEQNFSPTGSGRLPYDPVANRVADRRLRGGTLYIEGWLRPRSNSLFRDVKRNIDRPAPTSG